MFYFLFFREENLYFNKLTHTTYWDCRTSVGAKWSGEGDIDSRACRARHPMIKYSSWIF